MNNIGLVLLAALWMPTTGTFNSTASQAKGCFPDTCCVFDNTVIGTCRVADGLRWDNRTGCWCDEACHYIFNDCCYDFVSYCLEGNRTDITTCQISANNIPYGFNYGDSLLRGDDEMSELYPTGIRIAVGDGTESFTHVSVCTNGYLSLDQRSCTYNPQPIVDLQSLSIVAGYWTDLYDCTDASYLFYRSLQRTGSNGLESLDAVSEIIRSHMIDYPFFKANWAFIATWVNYCLYNSPLSRITFQIAVTSDGVNTFAIIHYKEIQTVKDDANPNTSIGYKTGSLMMQNQFSFSPAVKQMHELPGNTKCDGLWIYQLTEGSTPTDETKCLDWYLTEKESWSLEWWMVSDPRFLCPCAHSFMQFEFFWRVISNDGQTVCYATLRVWPMSSVCCYPADNFEGGRHASPPLAGTYVSYNPVWPSTKGLYKSNEKERKRQCCDSGHCQLYYEVRPITNCYIEFPWILGWNFGDPHIETLDGHKYTFNGFGEYTMIRIKTVNISFELQARTDLATNGNRTEINATVFTAFVARDHTGSSVQVELSESKSNMIIYGNGIDQTYQFYNGSSFFVVHDNLILTRENETIIGSFIKSDIVIKISVGTRLLILQTIVSSDLRGKTEGLMGNFDGDPNNDFILPDGTTLNQNETSSERSIFEKCGQKWSVNSSTTIFKYPKGKSHEDFDHPNFVPFYVDEFPQEDQQEAKFKCGGESASQACIFDYLATKNDVLASESGATDFLADDLKAIIANRCPLISGDQRIHAKIGEASYLQFNASDDKDYRFQVLSSPSSGFTFNYINGNATWIPEDTKIASISVTAVDESSLQASPVDVWIVLCSGCSGNGECDYNQTISTSLPTFSFARCICHVGWSGQDCNEDTDSCIGNPCIGGSNCTDLTPEEEETIGRGFNCSACPLGYREKGNKCEDIDECLDNMTSDCTQRCVNTGGSYECACHSGFRLNGRKCQDINECGENIDDCRHQCENTDGSFFCSCFFGYSLAPDNASCTQVLDICSSFGFVCEYGCNNRTDDSFECVCPRGFEVDASGSNCTNINECTQNTCNQVCTDTDGSFLCSCLPGFHLAEDKSSCIACEIPYYGENCTSMCQCGLGSDKCDPVHGCICNTGWSGADCDEDVDECLFNQSVCQPGQICENRAGSYVCSCQDGFTLFNGSCEDVDECIDESEHNCSDIESTCENNFGSFSCKCKLGYQQATPYTCTDIDECSMGLHHCSQICDNVEGTYNCDCEFGFSLEENRKTCKKVSDVCAAFGNFKCSYGCKVEGNVAFCFCPAGYFLDPNDNQTCIDINECNDTRLNQCSEPSSCLNTEGNYKCSCKVGTFLENNGRTCKEKPITTDGAQSTEPIFDTTSTNPIKVTEFRSDVSLTTSSEDTSKIPLSTQVTLTSESDHLSSSTRDETTLPDTEITATVTGTSQTFRLVLTIDISTNGNISVQGSVDYQAVKLSVFGTLKDYYTRYLSGFVSVLINSIRAGSLIVDHNIETSNLSEEDAIGNIMAAITPLTAGTRTLLFNARNVKIIDAVTVDKNTNKTVQIKDPCSLHNAFSLCKDDESCTVNGTRPVCLYTKKNKVPKDGIQTILILAVVLGIMTFLPLTICVIIAIKYCKGKKPIMEKSQTETARERCPAVSKHETTPVKCSIELGSRQEKWDTGTRLDDDNLKGYVFYTGR